MSLSLNQCKENTIYKIKSLNGDSDMKHFFKHVGLTIGDSIRLVNQVNHHTIIYLKGSRYAMEETIAKAIIVE